MKHVCFGISLLIICSVFFTGSASAGSSVETGTKLPPGFRSIVPEGMKVSSAIYSRPKKKNGFATVEFNASTSEILYKNWFRLFSYCHVKVICYDPKTFTATKPFLRMAQDRYADQKIKELSRPQSSPIKTFSPPEVNTHAWGKGIVQKVNWREEIPGSGKPKTGTTYDSHYYGIIGNSVFEAHLTGVLDKQAKAEEWIKAVTDKIAATDITNITE